MRLGLGTSILLALQLGLFFVAGLAWQGILDPHAVLPPLDRGVTALSLLVIVWLWSIPQAIAWRDALFGFLGLVAAIFLADSLSLWPSIGQFATFNGSWLDWTWQVASLVIILSGVLVLALTRPLMWGYGQGMLGLFLIGHLVQVLNPGISGDYPGAVRLLQLAAYPLLLSLPQRIISPPERQRTFDGLLHRDAVAGGQPQKNLHLPILTSFLALAEEARPETSPAVIARAIAHALHADRCYLVGPLKPEGPLYLPGGYDLQQDLLLPGMAIKRSLAAPVITAQKNNTLLNVEPDSPIMKDLQGFAHSINLPSLGNLLFSPVLSPDRKPLGGLLFLSPYSGREWTAEDQEYLVPVVAFLASIFVRSVEPAPAKEVEKVRSEARSAWRPEEPSAILEPRISSMPQPRGSKGLDIAAILAVQAELNDTVARLQAENYKLQEAYRQSSQFAGARAAHSVELESRFQNALVEIDRLRAQIHQLGTAAQDSRAKPLPETFSPTVQELHQPVNAILGYMDLLLGESMGNITPLQRKFLERTRAAVEKIQELLPDLERSALPGNGAVPAAPYTDLNALLDRAIAYVDPQSAAKNVTLQVEIPPDSPRFRIDPDTVNQILIHLLQNACAVTPAGGTVILSGEVQREDPQQSCVLIRVRDAGGGIPVEDLPGVFSPQTRTVPKPLRGIGDPGAGLSISKALTDALGGQIWVDSDSSKTSTFSVLLPIQANSQPVDGPGAEE